MDRTETLVTRVLCTASVSVALLLSGCSGGSGGALTGTAGPADAGQSTSPAATTSGPVTPSPAATTTKAAVKATATKTTSVSLSEGHVFIAAPSYGEPKRLLGLSSDSTVTVLGVSTDPSTQWLLRRISSSADTFQLMSPVNSEEIDAYCLSNDAKGSFSLQVCDKKKKAQAFRFTGQGKNTFLITAAGGGVTVKDDSIVSTSDETPTVFTVTSTPEDS